MRGFGVGRGAVEIEERSFVAKGAPLDDGQKRLGGWTGRLGEADRLMGGARIEDLTRRAQRKAGGKRIVRWEVRGFRDGSFGEGRGVGGGLRG